MDLHQLFDVSGRTALITGCSSPSGFGAAFAHQLAKCGANVVVAARRSEPLEALVEELNNLSSSSQSDTQPKPGQAKAVLLDLSKSESEIEPAVDQAWQAFGCIDILVNNAGVDGKSLPNLEFDQADFDHVMSVNVRGLMTLSKLVARKLIPANLPGNFINIASISGGTMLAPQFSGHANYCSSKAAVVQCTKALAVELAPHNIRVNCINPGWFLTDMSRKMLTTPAGESIRAATPLQKFGDVGADLLGPLLMLASRNASGFTTGSVVTIDGGFTCQGPVRFD
ncbi:NAD(P)-binding Rossmann-fold superfamily protein [Klebsormidium nitens]|uniref:NAD(P)-binding Rossmann-fold superfamily protein n=1 Tax=Klebsormidium nitens TaxID=105231 RepID=A0A0U9HJL8_KLENI|nr:NAD(P)-binding Rossmann-fold superfamily protein [Klebsormidium nitens]|eukprot:GAQ81000.1 NAD(P)-binding Rossmann-fold superfamily protein [Klebsormidium nitens]